MSKSKIAPRAVGEGRSRPYVKKNPGINLPTPHPSPLRGEGGGGYPTDGGGEEAVKQIKELTALLNPKLRKQVLAELSLQALDADIGEVRDLDMWAASVYDAIVASNGGGAMAVPGPAILKRALAAGGAWSYVRGFMVDAKLDELNVAERQSVYGMLARMVVQQAKRISSNSNAPFGPKLVANCSHNVGALFDRDFPGYLKAGLARIVARQLTNPQEVA